MSEPCCTPITQSALSPDASRQLAEDFKVLADPVRLRLLSLIASVPEGEACACDLSAPLERSQGTVSHHLSVLVKAGLITREQRGKWAWFAVAPERAEFVRSVLAGGPVVPVS
ncbi:MAG TPA: metalloregulator ArsR/SmtB family transcription factor [Acidimicrobiia bacterium]|jgi:ArsR family transcriptional regulator|nr:metalloregulator ArsR/SmtB family transcription factor [Acidimicrobiia bacterium]